MPTTLVTGANGFVAAHIIDALISSDHDVVGSVRTGAKGKEILDLHPEWASKLKFVPVADYAKPGVWDEVFQEHDVDYVIHTAAPLLDDERNTDFERDFLKPGVDSALEILKSATKYGKSVKAIVVTGSINAVTTGQDVGERVYDSNAWLPLAIKDAIEAQNPYISYCVSKAEAEKAIWKYLEDEKPAYSVSVLLPALIFGPPIQPIKSVKKMNYSTDRLYELFNGTFEVVPPTSFPSYIDVRDLATAHIKSLTTPEVFNKRFLVGGLPYSTTIAVNSFKSVPELKGRLPKENDEVAKVSLFGDVHDWNEKLDLKLRSTDETFGDTARRVLELEKQLGV